MFLINHYIEHAIKQNGLKSANQLSLHLGLSKPQAGNWLARRTLPSDETMVKLAECGKQDVDLALLYLNWWRAVDRQEYAASDHYKHLIEVYQNSFFEAA